MFRVVVAQVSAFPRARFVTELLTASITAMKILRTVAATVSPLILITVRSNMQV